MKKISDYQGADAIELWADIVEKFSPIVSDEGVRERWGEDKPMLLAVQYACKKYPKEVEAILLRVDPTPINGLNIIPRALALIGDITTELNAEEIADFF